MSKLEVLCIVIVSVMAKPGTLLTAQLVAPFTYSSVVVPTTTTITKHESSIVHPLPHYSVPLAYTHFIKKRSTLLGLPVGYCAPSTYIAPPFLSPISTFPYLIPQTYLVSDPFAAPFNHILKNPVSTYNDVSAIPHNEVALKSDVVNNVPKIDATMKLSTEAPKYEAMNTYNEVANKFSSNTTHIQRDSYGKPIMNNPVPTESKTQNCRYNLEALFKDGSLICEDPPQSQN